MNKELFNRFTGDVKRYLSSMPKPDALGVMNDMLKQEMVEQPPSAFAKRFEANPTYNELQGRKSIVLKVQPLTNELKEEYRKAYHEKMKIASKMPHDYVLILPHGVVMQGTWDSMVQLLSVKIPLFIIKKDFSVGFSTRGLTSIVNSYLPYKKQLT